MRRLNILIPFCLVVAIAPTRAAENSQEKEFRAAIDQLMEVSFQSDSLGLIRAIGEFERYLENQELEYLARYYMAFGRWQSVLLQLNVAPGDKSAIQLLRSAIDDLETSIKLRRDFVDAYALSLNCHYPLYYLEPEKRRDLAMSVISLRKRALELGPKNPRVVLTLAQNTFYTPEQFGGSQERGIQGYMEAIELFQEQRRSNPLLPNWGHEIAYAWLGNAYLNQKHPDILKAKRAFEKSLELRPDFAWVRDTMMPQIEQQMKESERHN